MPVTQLSKQAQAVLVAENLTPEEFEHMAAHSAITSEFPGFNRRFHHWVLDIRSGVCHNLSMIGGGQPRNQLQQ